MLEHDSKEIEIDKSVRRQDLIWKGALILVCAAIFVLMMLADKHDAATQCTESDPVMQEACLRQIKAEAARPPAKGPYPVVVRTTEQPGH